MSKRDASRRSRNARHRQERQGGLRRRLAFTGLAAAILLLAGWLVIRPFVRAGSGDADEVLLVQADMGGFRPKVIRARAGERITIRLESLDNVFHTDGGGKHQLAIDDLGVDLIAPAMGSREVTLVVDKPGVYPFYCSICCGGKANRNMWGRLVVES